MGSLSRAWTLRFLRRLLFWMLPAALVWVLLTPFYNRFLIQATENLLHLFESPNVTNLLPKPPHHLLITRADLQSKGVLYSIRVTDTHFPVILTIALFLAVPGLGWRVRAGRLGWALLISAFFHLVSLLFYVQFAYATQLGSWSGSHYAAWEQLFFGLGKHLLDVPFKFALPFVLWMAFHLRLLTDRSTK